MYFFIFSSLEVIEELDWSAHKHVHIFYSLEDIDKSIDQILKSILLDMKIFQHNNVDDLNLYESNGIDIYSYKIRSEPLIVNKIRMKYTKLLMLS
jgi:hypothetical protein